MRLKFRAFGHPNITATHPTTLEFTREKSLSEKGTCIVGVRADIPSLDKFLHKKVVAIRLTASQLSDTMLATPNPDFSSGKELVVRKSGFLSDRTFAVKASKAAVGIDRRLVALLKNPHQKLIVEISDEEAAE
jgi:hypothetical protein